MKYIIATKLGNPAPKDTLRFSIGDCVENDMSRIFLTNQQAVARVLPGHFPPLLMGVVCFDCFIEKRVMKIFVPLLSCEPQQLQTPRLVWKE